MFSDVLASTLSHGRSLHLRKRTGAARRIDWWKRDFGDGHWDVHTTVIMFADI